MKPSEVTTVTFVRDGNTVTVVPKPKEVTGPPIGFEAITEQR